MNKPTLESVVLDYCESKRAHYELKDELDTLRAIAMAANLFEALWFAPETNTPADTDWRMLVPSSIISVGLALHRAVHQEARELDVLVPVSAHHHVVGHVDG